MKITLRKSYNGVDIEISTEYLTSSDRAKAVRELIFTMENIDEKFNMQGNDEESISISDEEEADYTKVTESQRKYLRQLGYPEDKIEKIKTKKEASAILSKLQGKN